MTICDPLGQDPRQVLVQPAAGDVGDAVHHVLHAIMLSTCRTGRT